MKKFQNIIEYGIVLFFSWIMRVLPLKIVLWNGKMIGLFFYYVLPIRKSVAIENISRTFPEKDFNEVKLIAKNTYIQFAKNITEFMRFSKLDKTICRDRVTFFNQHLFQQVHELSKGSILLSGHFGNWEIMAAAISYLGYPIAGIAREQRNSFIDKFLSDTRRKIGMETIPLGMALRGVLRALKAGKFIAMLGDQDAHDEGVFVDFLGRPSATAQGPAIFALKTGAPILFGCCVRIQNGDYEVHLELIKTDDLNGLSEDNIKILTQRHATVLENSIRKWPDHWFWMHKRWKTQPKPGV
jgi:Kdo2-lipid IVA lauroyltransferase/acyltransferase